MRSDGTGVNFSTLLLPILLSPHRPLYFCAGQGSPHFRPLHLLFPLIGFSSFSSSCDPLLPLFRCHLLREPPSDIPCLKVSS